MTCSVKQDLLFALYKQVQGLMYHRLKLFHDIQGPSL